MIADAAIDLAGLIYSSTPAVPSAASAIFTGLQRTLFRLICTLPIVQFELRPSSPEILTTT
jgi:hypothetical protein